MDVTEKTILLPEDVAKELGVCLKTVYTMCKDGNLPHVKAGDRYLIPRKAFAKWLECQSVTK
jgi:excisionase family DNA binding protein